MVLGIFAMALPSFLGHMQGTNGASPRRGAVSSAFMRGGVHRLGGDTGREQLGHRQAISVHRVVEVAHYGVGDDRGTRSPCDQPSTWGLLRRGQTAQFSSQGPWLMGMQCSVTMKLLGANKQARPVPPGIFSHFLNLAQGEFGESHALGIELAGDGQGGSLVMGT